VRFAVNGPGAAASGAAAGVDCANELVPKLQAAIVAAAYSEVAVRL
jgi:hypothetical protein